MRELNPVSSDDEYCAAGARILGSAEEIYGSSDMIMKVKEPLSSEYALIRPDQIIFTYFHFAASEELTRAMQKSGCHVYRL